MSKLFLLWLTLIFSILFLFYQPTGEVGFPFDDMKLSAQNYIYFLFEKLIVLILAFVIMTDAKEYRFALRIFWCIAVIDLFDYILFYANPWFDFPLTWNVIKVAIFGVSILYEKYGR